MTELNLDLVRQMDVFMESGRFASYEELLTHALESLRRQEELKAVMEGMNDIADGHHYSIEEVDYELREKYQIEPE